METITKRVLLRAIELISQSEIKTKELRGKYGTEFPMIIASIEGDLIKDEAKRFILSLVPICFKIGGKVFLLGDTEPSDKVTIGGCDFEVIYELFDITTEIKTGDSYSFYTTSIDYFDFATINETYEADDFLIQLQ